MRPDSAVRKDVERELEWEPSVDERGLAVSVVDGIVTLKGEVRSFAEKYLAERAVERVAGVRGVANDLVVKSPGQHTDTEIAQLAVRALQSNVLVPADHVKVKVEKGWVTLSGSVDWDYQRRAAERAVRTLPGVIGLVDEIVVRPRVEPQDVKRKIEDALKRRAIADASHVSVEAHGGEVVLHGTVHSWAERNEAERAAWSAPGVTAVKDYIAVDPSLAA